MKLNNIYDTNAILKKYIMFICNNKIKGGFTTMKNINVTIKEGDSYIDTTINVASELESEKRYLEYAGKMHNLKEGSEK